MAVVAIAFVNPFTPFDGIDWQNIYKAQGSQQIPDASFRYFYVSYLIDLLSLVSLAYQLNFISIYSERS